MKSTIIVIILLFIIPHYPTISNAIIAQEFGHLGHVGVDFNIPVDTEVYADLGGVVIETAEDSRCYGRYLMIQHFDGNASLYAHLSKIKVSRGDLVISGQLIALSGGDPKDSIDGDGWSSGAHLHWEVRVKGHLDNNLYNINPFEYLASYELNGIYHEE